MSAASEAYKRAFRCGVGGHDGHPEDDFGNLTNEADQVHADRCTLALEWATLRNYAIILREAVNDVITDCKCGKEPDYIPCPRCQKLDDVANEHEMWVMEMLGDKS